MHNRVTRSNRSLPGVPQSKKKKMRRLKCSRNTKGYYFSDLVHLQILT